MACSNAIAPLRHSLTPHPALSSTHRPTPRHPFSPVFTTFHWLGIFSERVNSESLAGSPPATTPWKRDSTYSFTSIPR